MDHYTNWLEFLLPSGSYSDVISLILPFIVLGIFALIFRIIANILQKIVIKLTTRIGVYFDENTTKNLIHPFRFLVLIGGVFLALELSKLPASAFTILSLIAQTLLQFFVFQIFYHIVPPISQLLDHLGGTALRANFVHWTAKVSRILIVFIGAVSILQLWGIEVAPIIGGLGLLGAAIALGSQDLFKNLIGGLLIVTEDRFGVGDTIHVAGLVEGTIEKIGMRSCLLRQFDDCPVFVSNAHLADAAVINYTRRRHRRIDWYIGLEYNTTIEQLKTVRNNIETFITQDERFVHDPMLPIFVRIDRFESSSIDVLVYCFTKGNSWSDWLATKEALAIEIKRIVEKEGCGFAFPSRSIYIERDEEEMLVNPNIPYSNAPSSA